MDADHSEARFHIAQLDMAAKRTADAIAALERLASSPRSDAIEWLVEARFDGAFAPIRANAKYRAAVGLDRKAKTPYERLMGFGGRWEQVATCGEKPNVVFAARRDRTFTVAVSIRCNGQRFDHSYNGTWRLGSAKPSPGSAAPAGATDAMMGDHIVLLLPPSKSQAASDKDEAPCAFIARGDEEALHCVLGDDLDFEVLPTRR